MNLILHSCFFCYLSTDEKKGIEINYLSKLRPYYQAELVKEETCYAIKLEITNLSDLILISQFIGHDLILNSKESSNEKNTIVMDIYDTYIE